MQEFLPLCIQHISKLFWDGEMEKKIFQQQVAKIEGADSYRKKLVRCRNELELR
jgi:hypothetical protein